MEAYRSRREDVATLWAVVRDRPTLLSVIVLLNVFVAVLEGVGLGLLIPVIEQVQSPGSVNQEGVTGYIFEAYQLIGVPFTLEATIVGVGIAMMSRYVLAFVSDYLAVALQTEYVEELKVNSFESAVDAGIEFHDAHGSDEILDIVLTQVDYADSVVESLVSAIERSLLCTMYVVVALYLAPVMTVVLVAASLLVIHALRREVESSRSIGDRITESDRRIYHVAQEGIQGIRDVKTFDLAGPIVDDFRVAVRQYTRSEIKLGRNSAAMNGVYQLLVVITVLAVVYASTRFASLPLSSFGVFLFAIYRLVPQLNALNGRLYDLIGSLPHLRRAFEAMAELEAHAEAKHRGTTPPGVVDSIEFDDVSFAYEGDRVLADVSFEVRRGESVAFVGPSGAGKSTVVSLLARMYEPDCGTIRANGTPIDQFELALWRERIAVVRQSPYVFDRDLRFNLTLGADVSQDELERICEVTMVSEFLDALPNGYETQLGENGVRLSGGQRQRVALARALVEDADILVLDEATSEMDTVLEREVYDGIRSLDRDCLTITIAHRLSTITDSDRIYTVEDGEVVEVGSHEELIDRGGTYARMYASQS